MATVYINSFGSAKCPFGEPYLNSLGSAKQNPFGEPYLNSLGSAKQNPFGGAINLLKKDNNDPTLKAPIEVQPCSNDLPNKCKPCNEKHRHSRLCVKRAKCRMREREPSRVRIKTIIDFLKKKKSRDKPKKMVFRCVPVSSILYKVAKYFKHWKMKFIRKENSFYSSHFYAFKVKGERYCVAKRKVSLSGDVELNPGPLTGNTFQTISVNNQNSVLRYRMLKHGLQPLDVGGEGDCLFKSISHQLYGDSNRHVEIRATAVRFLCDNPDRFIESVVGTSWIQYLCNMSHQGTWADNIVIQAISDSMQLKINIVESRQTFRETTIIEPTICNDAGNIQSVYIGHIGEMHYVSTCPVLPLENSTDIEQEKSGEQNRAEYMKKYRKGTDSPEKRVKENENKRKRRAALNTPEKKAKRNAYDRHRRAVLKCRKGTDSPEKGTKENENKRKRRAPLNTPEKKAKRNAYHRHRRAVLKNTKTSVDVSVKKFHDIVKQGPLYICSCCDQLWYKHSVVNACKLGESQLDSAKYLCNKISLDDKEWICRTCNNYLMKNKLPSYAIQGTKLRLIQSPMHLSFPCWRPRFES